MRSGAAPPTSPKQHFIGWADEVDAEQLFTSGAAWGVKVVSQ